MQLTVDETDGLLPRPTRLTDFNLAWLCSSFLDNFGTPFYFSIYFVPFLLIHPSHSSPHFALSSLLPPSSFRLAPHTTLWLLAFDFLYFSAFLTFELAIDAFCPAFPLGPHLLEYVPVVLQNVLDLSKLNLE